MNDDTWQPSPPLPMERRRYSDELFPPYSYVSGFHPHPVSDSRGHMFGKEPQRPPPLDACQWMSSSVYLYGVDLLNHGYYWEAHETWESLWHAVGRSGAMSDFLKGLIKLAAAGVKAREGNLSGVVRHLNRGVQLFRTVAHEVPAQGDYCGIALSNVIEQATAVASDAERFVTEANPNAMLPIVLELNSPGT